MDETPAVESRANGNFAWLKVLLVGFAVLVTITLASMMVPDSRDRHGASDGPVSGKAESVPAIDVGTVAILRTVKYELSGPALDITYVAQEADIEQLSEATQGWSKTVVRQETQGTTTYLAVSARNPSAGTLSCRLIVDGSTVIEQTVSGAGQVVRCSSMAR